MGNQKNRLNETPKTYAKVMGKKIFTILCLEVLEFYTNLVYLFFEKALIFSEMFTILCLEVFEKSFEFHTKLLTFALNFAEIGQNFMLRRP